MLAGCAASTGVASLVVVVSGAVNPAPPLKLFLWQVLFQLLLM